MKQLFKASMMALLLGGAMLGASVQTAMAQATQPAQKEHSKDHAKEHKEEKKAAQQDKKAEKAGVTVGDKAPAFELKDTDGKTVKLEDFKGKIVVLQWHNPGCPFIVKHFDTHKTMANTYNQFKDQGVVWLAVNSSAKGKEGSGVELNKKTKADWAIPYPVLLDEAGTVGKAYGAKRTPEMFIINKDGVIAYHGAIDNNPDAKTAGDVNYVAKALGQLVKGETITEATTKAYGCSVKY